MFPWFRKVLLFLLSFNFQLLVALQLTYQSTYAPSHAPWYAGMVCFGDTMGRFAQETQSFGKQKHLKFPSIEDLDSLMGAELICNKNQGKEAKAN